MKVDIKKLAKDQLMELLPKLNLKMAACDQGGYKYTQTRKKYQALMKELKRRRDASFDKAPEVIRRDNDNQFGIINQKYYKTLNPIDQEIYINWKWIEL